MSDNQPDEQPRPEEKGNEAANEVAGQDHRQKNVEVTAHEVETFLKTEVDRATKHHKKLMDDLFQERVGYKESEVETHHKNRRNNIVTAFKNACEPLEADPNFKKMLEDHVQTLNKSIDLQLNLYLRKQEVIIEKILSQLKQASCSADDYFDDLVEKQKPIESKEKLLELIEETEKHFEKTLNDNLKKYDKLSCELSAKIEEKKLKMIEEITKIPTEDSQNSFQSTTSDENQAPAGQNQNAAIESQDAPGDNRAGGIGNQKPAGDIQKSREVPKSDGEKTTVTENQKVEINEKPVGIDQPDKVREMPSLEHSNQESVKPEPKSEDSTKHPVIAKQPKSIEINQRVGQFHSTVTSSQAPNNAYSQCSASFLKTAPPQVNSNVVVQQLQQEPLNKNESSSAFDRQGSVGQTASTIGNHKSVPVGIYVDETKLIVGSYEPHRQILIEGNYFLDNSACLLVKAKRASTKEIDVFTALFAEKSTDGKSATCGDKAATFNAFISAIRKEVFIKHKVKISKAAFTARINMDKKTIDNLTGATTRTDQVDIEFVPYESAAVLGYHCPEGQKSTQLSHNDQFGSFIEISDKMVQVSNIKFSVKHVGRTTLNSNSHGLQNYTKDELSALTKIINDVIAKHSSSKMFMLKSSSELPTDLVKMTENKQRVMVDVDNDILRGICFIAKYELKVHEVTTLTK